MCRPCAYNIPTRGLSLWPRLTPGRSRRAHRLPVWSLPATLTQAILRPLAFEIDAFTVNDGGAFAHDLTALGSGLGAASRVPALRFSFFHFARMRLPIVMRCCPGLSLAYLAFSTSSFSPRYSAPFT